MAVAGVGPTAEAVLELIDLRRRYGEIVALDGLTFTVRAGQVFGFLGPNGAGKTTTMRAVFNLVALDTGEVRWRGARIGEPERQGFGYMPEERGLYPGMRVLDQLVYLGRLHGLDLAQAREAAGQWGDRLGISGRFGDKLEALSLGNQQRVQLGAALLHSPQLLVRDEPFGGLDPGAVDTMSAILAERAAAGVAVLFSSHQLDLVEGLCQEVAIVHRGRVVVEGQVEQLARSGSLRQLVRVAGDGAGKWAARCTGCTAGRLTGQSVSVTHVASLAAARAGLRSGQLATVLVDGREVLIKQPAVGNQNSSTDTFAGTLAQVAGLQRLIEQLRPAGATGLAGGVGLPVRSVEGRPRDLASRFTGLAVALLIYLVILFYGVRIAQTVGEEKSSRVVEVLLATIRPTQLLTGKVIGYGVLAFSQMLAAGAAFVIAGLAVGSNALQGTVGGVAVVGALWLLLGYGLYCSAFAALGSLITQASDAANATFPLLIPLILAYALANGTLLGGASGFYRTLGFIPWTAPIAMPTLFAIGAAPVWQMLVSALICALATVATARLAGAIYQRAVLRTGSRVWIREVLRHDAI